MWLSERMPKVEPNNNPEECRRGFTDWLHKLKLEISEYLPLLWETMEELYVTNKEDPICNAADCCCHLNNIWPKNADKFYLNVKLYKFTWSESKLRFYQLVNQCWIHNYTTKGWITVVVVLILKERADCTNYRGISFLIAVYKVFAF
jgi:hypothetical protein